MLWKKDEMERWMGMSLFYTKEGCVYLSTELGFD